jgi:hypothetical protein
MQLFLVQGLKNSGERLPKGMQQRFVARAIREGIPLRSVSPGVRFSALGSVTVLLVALLLAVATLNNGDTGLADTAHKETSTAQEIPAHAVDARPIPARKLRLRRSREAIRARQVTPLFVPKLTFATNSEIIRRNAPHLLAECEQCTVVPSRVQSRFVFHGTLDPDTLRTGLKPDFKANVSHLVWNVVLQ